MTSHLRNFLIGVLLGIVVWVLAVAMVVAITEYCRVENSNMESHIASSGLKVRYANTITATTTAVRYDPRASIRGNGGVDGGDRQEKEVILYLAEVFDDPAGLDWANCVVSCESGGSTDAYNPLGYYGLFQFDTSTYYANGGTDIWDWREMIRIAKKLYDKGEQSWRWPVCDKKCQ